MTPLEIKALIETASEALDVLKSDLEEAEDSLKAEEMFVRLNAIQTDFEAQNITGTEANFKLETLGL